ncbi:MAG: hypothetical protein Q7K11_01235 [Candidatus Berkelbacteria bacterium]|nr:hypothetical protein [Candidatus Berkelbacteria bacterium]
MISPIIKLVVIYGVTTINGLTKGMSKLDFSTLTPVGQTFIIDNTHLSAQKVVLKIIKFFQLEKVKK